MNPCNLCLQPHAPPAAEPDAALFSGRCVLVNGPVIVGAGPSGLAVAAGLRRQGVPFVIIEQAHCIASLWQHRTYDRLNLHLPKKFCHLPYVPFPAQFPQYPTKHHFVSYLESYAETFGIRPNFNETVESAEHDDACGLWRVTTVGAGPGSSRAEYLCRWLVAATGENAEGVVPDFEGGADFGGSLIHSCDYKSGEEYREKRVLVVGCGNSGMEVALDLCQHKATPYMVVRSSVHVLPREILGKSTFEIGVGLVKWMPIWAVDKILVMAARMVLGDLGKYGVKRPGLGPLQLKEKQGKTPVLDTGTLCKIKSGHIKIVPGIKKFVQGGVEMVDGQILEVDAVILATGYTSNVANWLKDRELFSSNGLPKGWKGKNGVYAVGFTRRGLSGASLDAVKVARDIGQIWKTETLRHKNAFAGFSCRGRCKRNSPQP